MLILQGRITVLNYVFNKAKLPSMGSFMQESGRNLFWNWEKTCIQPFHCRDSSWKVAEISVVSSGDGFSPTVVLVFDLSLCCQLSTQKFPSPLVIFSQGVLPYLFRFDTGNFQPCLLLWVSTRGMKRTKLYANILEYL